MSRGPVDAQGWDLAVGSGLVRILAGLALLRWSGPLARLAGARHDDRVAVAVVAGFGARDTALGVSALAATRPGRDVRRQLQMQAVADMVDAAIVGAAVAGGRLPRGRGILGVLVALTSAAGLTTAAGRLTSG